jgi:hypothetical protein
MIIQFTTYLLHKLYRYLKLKYKIQLVNLDMKHRNLLKMLWNLDFILKYYYLE